MGGLISDAIAALNGPEMLLLLAPAIFLGSVLGIVVTLRPSLGGHNIFFFILTMLPALLFMGLLFLVAFYLSAAVWSLWFGREASGPLRDTAISFIIAISVACLISVLWVLAEFFISPKLEYGPVEIACMYVLFLSVVVALSRQPFAKIAAAMMLGLALKMVGIYPVTGELRMTFGTVELLRGFHIAVIILGIFVIAEILLIAEGRFASERTSDTSKHSWWGIPAFPVASVVIGCVLIFGFLPARWPEEVRLLNRIESDGTLFAMLFSSVAVALVAAFIVALVAKAVLRIPFGIVAPVVLVLAAIGAYAINNASLDMTWMLVFGVIGYLFVKLDYPRPVFFLAILVADQLESAAAQSALIFSSDIAQILTYPVAQFALVLTALLVGWRLVRPLTARFSPRFAG